MLNQQAIDWLEARGLDVETAVKRGVESTQRGVGEWLEIPYFRGGEVVNHKYRRIDEKQFSQDADAVKCFWNVDVLDDEALANEPLIIAEGEMDALALIQSGYLRTISVPDGAPGKQIAEDAQSSKYSFLPPVLDKLQACREIILATDGDPAGQALMSDLAVRIGRVRCRAVKYPKRAGCQDRCKDINEVLLAYGEKGVRQTVGRAGWMNIPGTYRMSELPEEPEPVPYTIDMPGFQDGVKIRLGDFSVWTGTPGAGKSTFLNDVSCRLVAAYGWRITFGSFEQHPTHDHRRFLRNWKARKAPKYIEAGPLAECDNWIDNHFRFVWPNEDEDVTLDWLLERFAGDVVRHDVKMFVIDPWNEMDHDRPSDMSETDYAGFAIRQLRRFARKYRVHVAVVAHPQKLRRDSQGNMPTPTLYDVSGSAHWANKADIGVVIDREKVRVAKVRYEGVMGRPGDYPIHFVPEIARFEVTAE